MNKLRSKLYIYILLLSPLPLGPYLTLLKKMISLTIAVTKLNLETDGQKRQSNVMLSGMSINDLAQFAGPTIKRFEPLPRPLVTVFTTCLANEMGSMLYLESTSSAAGKHRYVHGACIFKCTLHSEDSAPRSTSMQLFLVQLAFISASSISQSVSRKSCHCFQLVCVNSHRWISLLPSIECFLLTKTSSLLVLILILITMPLSDSTSRRGFFLG